MQTTLIILYSLFFLSITWYRFHYGLFLLFLLLPTYLIRFDVGPLPTTLVEVMIWILTFTWIIKYKSSIIYHLSHTIRQYPTLFIASALFLLSATISIFTSVDLRAAAGEWKAFYVEPIIVFLIIITTYTQEFGVENEKKIRRLEDYKINKSFNPCLPASKVSIFQSSTIQAILFGLVLCGLATSILAIYQHFTGWMVPYSFWENKNTYRVTGWYGFPNGVGLFLAPIVPLALYIIIQSWKKLKESNWKLEIGNWGFLISSFLFLISAPFAIFFAKSISKPT